jgi:hypothetical protein
MEPEADLYGVLRAQRRAGGGIVRRAEALCLSAAILALAACSFQNPNEREADRITQAVMNDDLKPVENDIGKGITITRVKVAEWSDELSAQGKLLSVKETTANCEPGWHCFDVKFEKHAYLERLRFDEHHQVVDWQFHMAPQ